MKKLIGLIMVCVATELLCSTINYVDKKVKEHKENKEKEELFKEVDMIFRRA